MIAASRSSKDATSDDIDMLIERAASVEKEAFALRREIAAVKRKANNDVKQAAASYEKRLADLSDQLALSNKRLADLRGSRFWRITYPARLVAHVLKRWYSAARLIRQAARQAGGTVILMKSCVRPFLTCGISGLRTTLQSSAATNQDQDRTGHVAAEPGSYQDWVQRYDTLTDPQRTQLKAYIAQLSAPPLISILMPTYNTPQAWLIECIESVRRQLYPHWELCIADDRSTDPSVAVTLQRYAKEDSRIKVIFRDENGHIAAASNSALEMASGEWVALLDHDDVLAESALFWVAHTIRNHPDAQIIYSDEDKIRNTSNERCAPYFKCDWNVDLFYSHNLITHLGVYRTQTVRALGGFRLGFEGAQDYDLALRFIETIAHEQILHIPRILYHWRRHEGSTAQSSANKPYAYEAGKRALDEHFRRKRINVSAEQLPSGMYRARYHLPEPHPLVSIIIPTKNGLYLLKQCVESLLAKTTYQPFEIIVIDNNSDDPILRLYLSKLAEHGKIRVIDDHRPFSYSALNNNAVKSARGEFVCLMNNDIEAITPDWLSEMLSIAVQPGVGVVGAKLWYPNDTLQHGGVILGIGGVAGHSHKHLPRGLKGYYGRADLIQSVSAVTGACMLVRKSLYEQLGGLNETELAVALNDVDFCLRVREAGYRNVWTPYAELYHHESASRGYEDTDEKKQRLGGERSYMQQRWGDLLLNDPAYSPNLTLEREDFSFAWPPRIPKLFG